MRNKIILLLIILLGLLFYGCSIKERNIPIRNIEEKKAVIEKSFDESDEAEIYAMSHSLGEKLRHVNEAFSDNDIVMIINGDNVSRRDVEYEKILAEAVPNVSYKERIENLIENRVINAEADRLSIEPLISDIQLRMDNVRKGMQYDNGQLKGYMEGLGLTEEEYLVLNEENAYTACKRVALWDKVKEPLMNKILKEADKRQISPDIVEGEYYKKYVEKLVKRAEINILDDELRKMIQND